MQPTFSVNGAPGMFGAFQVLAIVAAAWGFAVMVFWMVCGWRAMRAHERLADAAEKLSHDQGSDLLRRG